MHRIAGALLFSTLLHQEKTTSSRQRSLQSLRDPVLLSFTLGLAERFPQRGILSIFQLRSLVQRSHRCSRQCLGKRPSADARKKHVHKRLGVAEQDGHRGPCADL